MLYNPTLIYKAVCAQLRSSITATTGSPIPSQAYHTETQQDEQGKEVHEQNWTDRIYGGGRSRNYNRNRLYGRTNFQPTNNNPYRRYNKFRNTRLKKCYVCKKPNYWSTRHIPENK
jgi:hypothetical protein